MRTKAIANIDISGEEILKLPVREACQLFRSYAQEQQLQIIEATRDPRFREELYYLVPDGTELIQASAPEGLLQVMQTMMGTGLSTGILGAVTGDQLEEMIDLSVWRDGQIDREMVSLWLTEITECEEEDLMRLLPEVDLRILLEVVRDRVELKSDYKGLFVESGLVGLESLEYNDEQARFILEMLWATDEELFMGLLQRLFTETESDGEEYEDRKYDLSLEAARADRDERVHRRDLESGLAVKEEELFEEVDLDNLPLKRRGRN